MKNLLKKLLVFGLVIIISLTTITAVRADSGWDSSYDSGGFDSGGWDSGGWDSGYDSGGWSSSSSSHYHSSSSDDSAFLAFIVIIIFTFLIIYAINKRTKNISTMNNKVEIKSDMFTDVDEKLVAEMLPGYTLSKLKKELFNKFVEIQIAWMNFNYKKLRTLCTDELYNSYLSQLEVLKVKNGQNIMEYFDNIATKVYEIKKENNVITIEAFMAVTFYDYVINTKTGAVTRGSKNTRITNNYKMTFVVSNSKKNIKKCPSCGAPIKKGSSTTCEYCNSTIVKQSTDFVLSKKTNINN